MSEITIRSFSCIDSATISLKRLNIIIGPQGSGKSVTTKLVYFFTDIILNSIRSSEDGVSLPDFKKQLQKQFAIWFPPQAWGCKRFTINFTNENFSVRVLRRTEKGVPSDEVSFSFSKEFENAYETSLALYERVRKKAIDALISDRSSIAQENLERSWKTRDEVVAVYQQNLGSSTVTEQTFIPAGRAFFTSIGRLVAGIEHAGSLDPATLRFAKIFAGFRDRSSRFLGFAGVDQAIEKRKEIMLELFGGIVQSRRDHEFIEMVDGRKVPFSSLSSGQQELLSIWYFLENMIFLDSLRSSKSARFPSRSSELIYIEEPEAHLFPAAQSKLLDVLVEVVLSQAEGRNLILTTHSPYILSKVNVLLKAGQLSRRKRRIAEIGEIVPRSCWLRYEDVTAHSIEGGAVSSIMNDEHKLVDAGFLDQISNVISDQFLALLDLEG